MKSKTIKIRNLPEGKGLIEKTIQVKPVFLLIFFLVLGIALAFIKAYMIAIGVIMILLALFALFLLPDRILCQFTKDYLILYNTVERDECNLIYWDEIVSWQYEWHAAYDYLVIHLIDGSIEKQEMYSKRGLSSLMNNYAPGKEIKNRNRKK